MRQKYKKECDDDADNDDIAATNITFLFTFHEKVFMSSNDSCDIKK